MKTQNSHSTYLNSAIAARCKGGDDAKRRKVDTSTLQINETGKDKSEQHRENFSEEKVKIIIGSIYGQPTRTDIINAFKKESCFYNKDAVEKFKSITRLSPLVMAVELRDWDTVESLLDKGINVDDAPEDGGNALFYAIKNMEYEIARRLIDRGADPNKKNFGEITAKEVAMQIPDCEDDPFGHHSEQLDFKKLILDME